MKHPRTEQARNEALQKYKTQIQIDNPSNMSLSQLTGKALDALCRQLEEENEALRVKLEQARKEY